MRLASAILTVTFLATAAFTTADGRGIRIEGVGRQQDVSIGRETQIRRSESGILLIGEVSTDTLPLAASFETPFSSNFSPRPKSIDLSLRSRSRRGFRYGEGLGYSRTTRNAARYRSTTFHYGSGIRYGSSFSYGNGRGYRGPVRHRKRDAYKPNIQYGSGLRYGQELRHAIGRQQR